MNGLADSVQLMQQINIIQDEGTSGVKSENHRWEISFCKMLKE